MSRRSYRRTRSWHRHAEDVAPSELASLDFERNQGVTTVSFKDRVTLVSTLARTGVLRSNRLDLNINTDRPHKKMSPHEQPESL